ncbi:McrB family protein [Micromonospora psammae]|uniref:McrB family protein n=1 Tax=Micromonospora sp. CPCC 205556 TaxID=3122398 RepID=UPI002FF3DE1A
MNESAMVGQSEAHLRADPTKQSRFEKLRSGPYFASVLAANQAYLAAAVPEARARERDRWIITCLPGNGRSGRLSAISMRTMEVFVLNEPDLLNAGEGVSGFVVLRRSVLEGSLPPGRTMGETYPQLRFSKSGPPVKAEGDKPRPYEGLGDQTTLDGYPPFGVTRTYRDAGDDQLTAVGSYEDLIAALADEHFAAAARRLATDLMAGRTNHSRYHNYQLADVVLGRTALVPPTEETVDPAGGGVRYGLLVRTCLEVLRDRGDRIPGREVMAEVSRRVDLTQAERRPQKNGAAAWVVAAHFHTGDAATAGWMVKRNNRWWITTAGREALDTYPDPDDFYAEINRRYREVLRSRKKARRKYESRLHAITSALQRVEAGSWTAYDDLADLVAGSPDEIAHLLAETYVENSHRVLQSSGEVPLAEHQHFRHRGGDLAARLREEGVEFNGRQANPEQRLTASLLRDAPELPPVEDPAAHRAWLVRGSNVEGHDLVPQWLSEGFLSLAAAQLPELPVDADVQLIARTVDEAYRHKSYSTREKLRVSVEAFLRSMRPGDRVVTVHGDDVHLGIVDGPPYFADSIHRRSHLRRDVNWLDEAQVPLRELSGPLLALIKSPGGELVDLTDAVDAVDRLISAASGQTPTVEPTPHARLAAVSQEVADRLLLDLEFLSGLRNLLEERRQVILYGPPGTGKTFLATQFAAHLTEPHAVQLVQFHPSYTYEDFFEGFRPQAGKDGMLRFELTSGPLRKLADEAREHPWTPYILVIDEINRGNLAKIFGELYFLLEYRDQGIRLQYSPGEFTLPPNLYVIGTMNTADRSIAAVDVAMRRRFAFVELHPSKPPIKGLLRRWLDERGEDRIYARLLDALNDRIGEHELAIGPSYFMRPFVYADPYGLDRVWEHDILPLLQDHHYADDIDVVQHYDVDELLRTLPPEQP